MLKVNPLIVPSGGSLNDFYAGGVWWRGGTYYQGGINGVTDTQVGTISFWIRRGTWATREQIHDFPGGWNPLWIADDDTIQFAAHDTSGAYTIVYIRTSALPRDQLWHHIAIAFNLVTGTTLLYRDGVSDKVTINAALVGYTVDWTRPSFLMGRNYDADQYYLRCSLAEYYLNTKEFVDISVPANLRKFINAAGKPANLGPDGSWVTGNKPLIYLHHTNIATGAASSDFMTNRGSGGNLANNGGGSYEDPLLPSSPWKQVFGVTPYDSAGSYASYTNRTRIAAAGIFNKPLGQTQVRVSVAGSPTSSGITIDKLYIGNQSGANQFSAGDLTQLFYSGAPGVTLTGAQSRWSDAANWVYTGGPILLTAHYTGATNTPNIGYNTNVQGYYLFADDASALSTSGYSANSAAYCYLFTGIEMM